MIAMIGLVALELNLRVHRHVGFQFVVRVVDVDLDAIDQLHALLLGLNLLGRELGLRGDERDAARDRFFRETNRW